MDVFKWLNDNAGAIASIGLIAGGGYKAWRVVRRLRANRRTKSRPSISQSPGVAPPVWKQPEVPRKMTAAIPEPAAENVRPVTPLAQERSEYRTGLLRLLSLEILVSAAVIIGIATWWSSAGWLGYGVNDRMSYETIGVTPLSGGAIIGWAALVAVVTVALGAFSALNRLLYSVVLYWWIPYLSREMLGWFGNVYIWNHKGWFGALIATIGVVAGLVTRYAIEHP